MKWIPFPRPRSRGPGFFPRTGLAVLLACMLLFPAGCSAENKTGSVYYLSFKTEQDPQWKELAETYTRLTGVPVRVVTANSGHYQRMLATEMEKNDAPTLFQIDGSPQMQRWASHCCDLSDTALYRHLTDSSLALRDGDRVIGIGYVIESYGLACNKALLKKAGYTVSDITDFASLKRVADDIQSRREELGLDGAFASPGMNATSDWRFKTHLASLPLAYEYRDGGVERKDTLDGTYLDGMKHLWDLYITDTTCPPDELAERGMEDALREFAGQRVVFLQTGTWAYNEISSIGKSRLGFLPLYMDPPNDADQGFCTGSENFWCINSQAAPEDIEATKAFVEWVITSDEGRRVLSQEMGFVTPFDTFTEEYTAHNPMVDAVREARKAGRETVPWSFVTIPTGEWKNRLGAALTSYAAGKSGWDRVEAAYVDGWTQAMDELKGE